LASEFKTHDHEVRGTGFKHLTPVREAIRILFANLPSEPLSTETVSLSTTLGRILAEDITSLMDCPPVDKAAMDGLAVSAEDTYGATPSAPLFLKLVGKVDIGTIPDVHVGKGEAASIVTGGQMPESTNAVVMVEFTKTHENGLVEIWSDVHPNENVARAGEDVRKGRIVLKRGTRALPQDIGMMSQLGLDEIRVVRKPRIAVLSTGNELRDGTLTPEKTPDANRPALISAVHELGCEAIDLGIVSDDSNQIRERLLLGLRSADIVIVTAGTSVGPEDDMPHIINSLGKPGMLVHGIAMRPSMPTGLAVVNGKPVISLPGYPVSAYLAFVEFVKPLVAHMVRSDFLPEPVIKARLNRRIAGILGSRTYVRVRITLRNEEFTAEPVRTSGAGILSSLVQANGFIIIPENAEGYEEGQAVNVQLFRPYER